MDAHIKQKIDSILTSSMTESDSPSGAQERIAQLSQAVYNYFTRDTLFVE